MRRGLTTNYLKFKSYRIIFRKTVFIKKDVSKKSFAIVSRNKINDFKKIYVDSDKSISIRAFLFSAISENISIIKNPLLSEDVISTIKCLKKLGVKNIKGEG